MATITKEQAQAWADKYKLNIDALDTELEAQIVAQVFSRVGVRYDTSTWENTITTPSLVSSIIAMIYTGRVYQQRYAIDTEPNAYGTTLINDALNLIELVVNGEYPLTGNINVTVIDILLGRGTVSFEPTEPVFTMDQKW